jgi:hypothetical protein
MMVSVNFSDLGGPVFVGRANGKNAREKLNVDSLDQLSEPVTVTVPENTYSINSSYFLGLFGPSVVAFGSREAFFDHYRFNAPDVVMDSIARHVSRALVERGALKLE